MVGRFYYLVPYEGPVGREVVDFPSLIVTRIDPVKLLAFHAFEPNLVRPLVSGKVLGHLVLASLVPDQLHRAVDSNINQIETGSIVLSEQGEI